MTQQLQSILTGLYHSAQDDEQVVVKQVTVSQDGCSPPVSIYCSYRHCSVQN